MFGIYFEDRYDAAQQLLPLLEKFKDDPNTILLAIPRGALEMGNFFRDKLRIPLDIVVTKKIGAPDNEEYAVGSVAPDGSMQVDSSVISSLRIPQKYLDMKAQELKKLIDERYKAYRGTSILPDLKNKTVIIIDDGIATGFTTLAAVQYVKTQKPHKVILAVPVAAPDSFKKLQKEVDEIICLKTPWNFSAVGQFYKNFPQVSDKEAKELLHF